MKMADKNDAPGSAIAETENYIVWRVQEPDGETTYHIELGTATLHFFREEWDEFLKLIKDAASGR